MSTKNSTGFVASLALAVAVAICGASSAKADDFSIDISPFTGGLSAGQGGDSRISPNSMSPIPVPPKVKVPVYEPLTTETSDSANFFADHRAEMKREREKLKKEKAEKKAKEEKEAQEEEESAAELTDEERATKARQVKEDEAIEKATEEADGKEFEWDTTPKLESDDPHHFLRKAKFYVKHEQYKQALEELNNALTLQPNCWEAHHIGAQILHMQGRDKEAIARYQYYLDVCPNDIAANINLGNLMRKVGKLTEAEKYCKKATDIDFYSCDAHYSLSKVLFDKGDQAGALAQLNICMKMNKNNANVHNDLGVLYQKRGYLEEAQEEYIKALKLEPANKTFLKNLELLRERLKGQQQPVKNTNASDLL